MNPELDWQRRYEANDTPWDKGAAAPALRAFLRGKRISGDVLVPGCGRGHEVRAVAEWPGARVVGLDLSPLAIAQARELTARSGLEGDARFIIGDFLDLPAGLRESFDWVVEHTCFCALEPSQRTDYVPAASAALRAGGMLFAIFYIDPDTDAGPPFAVSRKELAGLFEPHFLLLEEWVPPESFPGRENRELVMVWRKR